MTTFALKIALNFRLVLFIFQLLNYTLISCLNFGEYYSIRAYYGQEDGGVKNLILVGVTADENDMVDGLIGDRSFLCPSRCATRNDLNHH